MKIYELGVIQVGMGCASVLTERVRDWPDDVPVPDGSTKADDKIEAYDWRPVVDAKKKGKE